MRADHEVLVELPGLRPPTVHTLNDDTLGRIWDSVRHLPMSRFEHHVLERRLTGPCARRDIVRELADTPAVTLPCGDRELRLSWANPPR
ncbi:hypothetical protein AB0E96_28090 [Kitasatospora sp. NPDC036755]|uniref:hypothetical protein n=1 Tax=Kitasatospora sp. NPDC036755 TaxID=3154600 RepID=UPI00340A781E